ncbi:hypothetical protein [Rubrivirga sp. IMCC45206]|uniref:hypothetical protein n=1 Tax=Rubrivirga sp. IMCC45206 TaxID=3391614 RepID=UPI003990038B
MLYPFQLSFKILAVAPQIRVTDATGSPFMYVHQKAFKLKEAVTVYRDESKATALYTIAADRILDFNAAYEIRDGHGRHVGTLARKGRRSLWRARYDVLDADGQTVYRIHEDNAWTKVGDALFREIPLLGALGGYIFNPSYTVEADDPATPEQEGAPVFRLSKQPALWEGRFELERLDATLGAEQEELLVVSLLMMLLRERTRG